MLIEPRVITDLENSLCTACHLAFTQVCERALGQPLYVSLEPTPNTAYSLQGNHDYQI